MKISEIYAAIANGNLLDKDTGYLTMIAIELLARVEGVPVAALDLAAPRFALSYPFDKRDLRGNWHGATHFQAWRRLILDAQMQAAPGDVDGAPWSSLARSERLGFNSSGATFYDLPKHLTATMLPTDVTDAVITATYEGLDDTNRPRFRAGVNAFRRLFDNDLVQRTGLLPLIKPQPLPGLRDHRFQVPMSPEIEKARAKLFSTSTRVMLDYLHRLAVAGGRLNGKSDTLEDLRKALSDLPNPIDAEVPEITDQSLRGYINIVMRRIGGRDYRLTETEQSWSDLRKAARAAGCETSFIWALGKPATAWGLCPWEISETVALDIIRSYQDSSMRSQSRRGCEQFDALRSVLPPELFPENPLGIRRTPPNRKQRPRSKTLVVIAWDDLYAEITRNARITEDYKHLWFIRGEAIKDGKAPNDITQNWLEGLRDSCPINRLHALYGGVHDLRKISGFEHLQPLRTRRGRHGGLPESLNREVDNLLAEMGPAPTTYRLFKLAIGVLVERANLGDDAGMEDICALDLDSVDWGCAPQQVKSYSTAVTQLKKYRALPWTPEWKALQYIAVNAGMRMSKNPIPKLLSWEPGPSPKAVTLKWAQRLDRDLRSTILNGPHGRGDLAKTLARHVAAFDKLREIPEVAESGLMPEPIGSVRQQHKDWG